MRKDEESKFERQFSNSKFIAKKSKKSKIPKLHQPSTNPFDDDASFNHLRYPSFIVPDGRAIKETIEDSCKKKDKHKKKHGKNKEEMQMVVRPTFSEHELKRVDEKIDESIMEMLQYQSIIENKPILEHEISEELIKCHSLTSGSTEHLLPMIQPLDVTPMTKKTPQKLSYSVNYKIIPITNKEPKKIFVSGSQFSIHTIMKSLLARAVTSKCSVRDKKRIYSVDKVISETLLQDKQKDQSSTAGNNCCFEDKGVMAGSPNCTMIDCHRSIMVGPSALIGANKLDQSTNTEDPNIGIVGSSKRIQTKTNIVPANNAFVYNTHSRMFTIFHMAKGPSRREVKVIEPEHREDEEKPKHHDQHEEDGGQDYETKEIIELELQDEEVHQENIEKCKGIKGLNFHYNHLGGGDFLMKPIFSNIIAYPLMEFTGKATKGYCGMEDTFSSDSDDQVPKRHDGTSSPTKTNVGRRLGNIPKPSTSIPEGKRDKPMGFPLRKVIEKPHQSQIKTCRNMNRLKQASPVLKIQEDVIELIKALPLKRTSALPMKITSALPMKISQSRKGDGSPVTSTAKLVQNRSLLETRSPWRSSTKPYAKLPQTKAKTYADRDKKACIPGFEKGIIQSRYSEHKSRLPSPSTPASRSSTPSSIPTTPSSRPTTPCSRPSTPSNRPTTPSTRPSTPCSRPSSPRRKPTPKPLQDVRFSQSMTPIEESKLLGKICSARDNLSKYTAQSMDLLKPMIDGGKLPTIEGLLDDYLMKSGELQMSNQNLMSVLMQQLCLNYELNRHLDATIKLINEGSNAEEYTLERPDLQNLMRDAELISKPGRRGYAKENTRGDLKAMVKTDGLKTMGKLKKKKEVVKTIHGLSTKEEDNEESMITSTLNKPKEELKIVDKLKINERSNDELKSAKERLTNEGSNKSLEEKRAKKTLKRQKQKAEILQFCQVLRQLRNNDKEQQSKDEQQPGESKDDIKKIPTNQSSRLTTEVMEEKILGRLESYQKAESSREEIMTRHLKLMARKLKESGIIHIDSLEDDLDGLVEKYYQEKSDNSLETSSTLQNVSSCFSDLKMEDEQVKEIKELEATEEVNLSPPKLEKIPQQKTEVEYQSEQEKMPEVQKMLEVEKISEETAELKEIEVLKKTEEFETTDEMEKTEKSMMLEESQRPMNVQKVLQEMTALVRKNLQEAIDKKAPEASIQELLDIEAILAKYEDNMKDLHIHRKIHDKLPVSCGVQIRTNKPTQAISTIPVIHVKEADQDKKKPQKDVVHLLNTKSFSSSSTFDSMATKISDIIIDAKKYDTPKQKKEIAVRCSKSENLFKKISGHSQSTLRAVSSLTSKINIHELVHAKKEENTSDGVPSLDNSEKYTSPSLKVSIEPSCNHHAMKILKIEKEESFVPLSKAGITNDLHEALMEKENEALKRSEVVQEAKRPYVQEANKPYVQEAKKPYVQEAKTPYVQETFHKKLYVQEPKEVDGGIALKRSCTKQDLQEVWTEQKGSDIVNDDGIDCTGPQTFMAGDIDITDENEIITKTLCLSTKTSRQLKIVHKDIEDQVKPKENTELVLQKPTTEASNVLSLKKKSSKKKKTQEAFTIMDETDIQALIVAKAEAEPHYAKILIEVINAMDAKDGKNCQSMDTEGSTDEYGKTKQPTKWCQSTKLCLPTDQGLGEESDVTSIRIAEIKESLRKIHEEKKNDGHSSQTGGYAEQWLKTQRKQIASQNTIGSRNKIGSPKRLDQAKHVKLRNLVQSGKKMKYKEEREEERVVVDEFEKLKPLKISKPVQVQIERTTTGHKKIEARRRHTMIIKKKTTISKDAETVMEGLKGVIQERHLQISTSKLNRYLTPEVVVEIAEIQEKSNQETSKGVVIEEIIEPEAGNVPRPMLANHSKPAHGNAKLMLASPKSNEDLVRERVKSIEDFLGIAPQDQYNAERPDETKTSDDLATENPKKSENALVEEFKAKAIRSVIQTIIHEMTTRELPGVMEDKDTNTAESSDLFKAHSPITENLQIATQAKGVDFSFPVETQKTTKFNVYYNFPRAVSVDKWPERISYELIEDSDDSYLTESLTFVKRTKLDNQNRMFFDQDGVFLPNVAEEVKGIDKTGPRRKEFRGMTREEILQQGYERYQALYGFGAESKRQKASPDGNKRMYRHSFMGSERPGLKTAERTGSPRSEKRTTSPKAEGRSGSPKAETRLGGPKARITSPKSEKRSASPEHRRAGSPTPKRDDALRRAEELMNKYQGKPRTKLPRPILKSQNCALKLRRNKQFHHSIPARIEMKAVQDKVCFGRDAKITNKQKQIENLLEMQPVHVARKAIVDKDKATKDKASCSETNSGWTEIVKLDANKKLKLYRVKEDGTTCILQNLYDVRRRDIEHKHKKIDRKIFMEKLDARKKPFWYQMDGYPTSCDPGYPFSYEERKKEEARRKKMKAVVPKQDAQQPSMSCAVTEVKDGSLELKNDGRIWTKLKDTAQGRLIVNSIHKLKVPYLRFWRADQM